MKIIEKIMPFSRRKGFNQILLKMRLISLIIFISILQVSANTYSQQTKLDLNYKDITIKEVLNEIENQSQFKFLYQSDVIDIKKVLITRAVKELIDNIKGRFSELPALAIQWAENMIDMFVQ